MSGGPTGQGSARMRLFGSKCRNKGKVIFPLGIQGRKKEILTDIVNLQTYKKGFPSIEHILLVVVFRPGLRGPLVVREGSAGGGVISVNIALLLGIIPKTFGFVHSIIRLPLYHFLIMFWVNMRLLPKPPGPP